MSSNNSLPYNISEYALCDVLPVGNVTFLSGEDKCRWYASEGGGNPWRVSCRSGVTETGVKGPFCTCNLYYGYHSGPNCDWTDKYLTPECFVPSPLNNFDPCRLNSTGYPLIFTISSMVVVALATLLFFYQMYILRTLAKKKFTGFDSKWSTLIMSTVANFWFILWAAGGASPALTGDMFYERMVMRPIAIPMASFCMLTAGLNIVLMWVQVYRDSQNMKRAKQNLDNRSLIFVIVTCFLCFITLFVCFVILNSSALGSGATLVYLVLLIVVYSYGANKIKGMLKSSKSTRLQLIVGTSNKLILGFCNHIVLAGIIAVIPDAHKTNLFSIIFAYVVATFIIRHTYHCFVPTFLFCWLLSS